MFRRSQQVADPVLRDPTPKNSHDQSADFICLRQCYEELPPVNEVLLKPPASLSSSKVFDFVDEGTLRTPCLIFDVDIVERQYRRLRKALPEAGVFYAVKANPSQQVIRRLAKLGASFDIASPAEIDMCLAQRISPKKLSFGSTIKKERDVAYAHGLGVKQFAFDSQEELFKLAKAAPGGKVSCRIKVDNTGADWPLSDKFGCPSDAAISLLIQANQIGLKPHSLSFHVGSQQKNAQAWSKAIDECSRIVGALRANGIKIKSLNLGGGFPAPYQARNKDINHFAKKITKSVARAFGAEAPKIAVEPGRYLVASAGIILSEVVLASRRSATDARRWVYLDVGRFNGLAETENEAIKYRISALPKQGAKLSARSEPVIIAGPTCDGADILYQNTLYQLPTNLTAGDRVVVHDTGAYTLTYSSVGFNGFEPLRAHFI